jgi:hypothetical protein
MATYFSNITYFGQNIDDQDTFDILPQYLKEFMTQSNGLIAFSGGIHFRGCVRTPEWHSLYHFWFGSYKLSDLFDEIDINDIPIAQDCFGDQFLIRKGHIIKLLSETGEVVSLETDFNGFIKQIISDPIRTLNIESIEDFNLQPGQLLSAFPPFCIKTDTKRSIVSIKAEDRIVFLSDLSKQLRNLSEGAEIRFEVRD